jgi:hypothetical protein
MKLATLSSPIENTLTLGADEVGHIISSPIENTLTLGADEVGSPIL